MDSTPQGPSETYNTDCNAIILIRSAHIIQQKTLIHFSLPYLEQ